MKLHQTSTKIISLKTLIAGIIIGSLASCSIIFAITLTTKNSSKNINKDTYRQTKITETETINFKTIEKEDNTKNNGNYDIKQEGKNGEKSIEYLMTYSSNGEIISKEKISEKITLEPVDKIVIIGTKKVENTPKQKQTTSNNNPTSTPPTEDPCKTKLVGNGRPTNCPKSQTRAEYTTLGGWEAAVKSAYENYKNSKPWKRCINGTCVYGRSGSFYHLCYSSFGIDIDTLTISSVEWQDGPAATCEDILHDHPPLPSAEYLTQYLRSIAK